MSQNNYELERRREVDSDPHGECHQSFEKAAAGFSVLCQQHDWIQNTFDPPNEDAFAGLQGAGALRSYLVILLRSCFQGTWARHCVLVVSDRLK